MSSEPSVSRALGAVLLTLIFGAASVSTVATAAADSRAKVISAELHRGAESGRLALRLQVRNFRSGEGQLVHVSHGDYLENDVFARRVNGSYRHWRVGPKTKEGRAFLADLAEELETKGVVRVDAGVLASAPSGGKLSHFRIKDFNEPAPALGALRH